MALAFAEITEPGTVITLEDKKAAEENFEKKDESGGFLKLPKSKKEENIIITEISFGLEEDLEPIIIYVSPSCLHCATFIVDELEAFIESNKNKHKFILKFLPISAKDVFIMKVIQNEIKDEDGFFLIFKNYAKRCLATINNIRPTARQEELFKGSKNDPEMIKFQVAALEFGFSEKKIVAAIPDMDGDYERKLMDFYGTVVEGISDMLENKDVNLPLIVKNDKIYNSLAQVSKE
ncbi:MAG: hypothetical protein LBU35_03760 [Holosporales bacterium]|jgi:hypothetical protein|nr:hypothetical protein [Holosporales bacterium]